MTKVTRFEYIDETGRAVVRHLKPNERIELSYQDEGRTLKVFLLKDEDSFQEECLFNIEMLQALYKDSMEVRDWYSCDYYSDQIAILRASLGIKGMHHPLDNVEAKGD